MGSGKEAKAVGRPRGAGRLVVIVLAATLTAMTGTAVGTVALRHDPAAPKTPGLAVARSDAAPPGAASPKPAANAPRGSSKTPAPVATQSHAPVLAAPGKPIRKAAGSPKAPNQISLSVTPSRTRASAGTDLEFTVRYTLARDTLLVVDTGDANYILGGCRNDPVDPRLVRHQRSGSTHTVTLRWSYHNHGHYVVAARVFSDCTIQQVLATAEATVDVS